jgi:hypothetical protein
MRSPLLLSITATVLAAWSAVAVGQALIAPAPAGKHPYDIALDYCAERGGLAQYSVLGETVEFSCSEDLTAIISIAY